MHCAPQSRQNSDADPLLIWLTGTMSYSQRVAVVSIGLNEANLSDNISTC